jgi:hypothetical protein
MDEAQKSSDSEKNAYWGSCIYFLRLDASTEKAADCEQIN